MGFSNAPNFTLGAIYESNRRQGNPIESRKRKEIGYQSYGQRLRNQGSKVQRGELGNKTIGLLDCTTRVTSEGASLVALSWGSSLYAAAEIVISEVVVVTWATLNDQDRFLTIVQHSTSTCPQFLEYLQ